MDTKEEEQPKKKNISTANPHYPVTINNYNSNRSRNTITFTHKPERVIANQQNTIETLLALNQDEQIIAASCTSNHTTEFLEKYKNRAHKLPSVNRYDFALETVLMLKPDLIIGWQSTFSPRVLRGTDFWKQRGVKTYIVENSNSILPIGRVEDELTFISNMGKIFDAEQEANKLIEEINTTVKDTLEKTKNRPKQRVVIIELMGKMIVTYDRKRLAGDMVTKLGGELIPLGMKPGQESLIIANPDVIFVSCIGWKEDAQFCVDRIMKNPVYRSINAVKNKRVYAIPLMYMYASATRTIDGIRTFRNGLYPDLAE